MGEGSARDSNADAQTQKQLEAWLNSPAGAKMKAALTSKDPRVAQGAMIQLGLQQDPQFLSKPGGYESFMDKFLPIVSAIGASVAFGPIVAGAFNGAANATVSGNQNILAGAAKGAVVGAVTSEAGQLAGPATTALSDAGVNPTLASGIVKGAIGAGTGAIGAKITGGNVGQGALVGGAGGAIKGVVSGASGSSTLGNIAGKVGGTVIGSTLAPSKGTAAPKPSGVMPIGNIGGGHASSGGNLIPDPNSPSGYRVGGGSGGGSNFGPAAGVVAGAGGAFIGSGGGGQGNNTDMGTTDKTLAGTIGDVLNTAGGVYGSQNAAEKQAHADDQAIQTQHDTMGNINDVWKTQRGLGQGADTALGRALGTDGKPADYSGFENMPGYKFAISQGTQAINRSAAAMGSAYTPNTMTSVGQYVTGTAMQDYNTYINQLMGAAGLGSTANTGVADASFKTGENISQLQQNKGQAEASGVMGASKNIGGFLGQNGGTLIDALSKYFKGNGSGGPSSGGPSGGNNHIGGSFSGAPPGGDVNGGIDPSTGIPNDIEQGGGGYDPWNGGNQPWSGGNLDADPNWNSVTDTYGTGSTDFGGGADYGGDYSGDFNFMGGP